MPTNPPNCPKCGAAVTATQKFCMKCGANLPAGAPTAPAAAQAQAAQPPQAAPPGAAGGRWRRRPGEVAARVELSDIPGWTSKPLIIEPGTKAILLGDGRIAEIVGPGTYDLARHKAFRRMSSVIIDGGDIPVAFTIPSLFTSDNMEVAVQLELVVQINQPEIFFTEFVKDAPIISRHDMANALMDEMANAARELVSGTTFANLQSDRDAKDTYDIKIGSHVRTSLERLGLEVVQVRSVEFIQPDVLAVRRQQSQNQVDKLKADTLEERAAVRERLMKAENLERVAGLRSQADLERIKREIDTKNAIDEVEWQKMLKIAMEGEEDRGLARRHMVAMLEEQRSHELTILQLRQEKDSQDLTLQLEGRQREFEREQSLLDAETNAKTADISLETLDKMKRQKLDREREARTIAREDELERKMADVEAQKRLIEIKKDLSPEQLMALAAENNPAAAAALGEKFKSENYERMLKEQKENADRVERISTQAMEKMGDVSAAASAGRMYRPGEMKSCPSCNAQNAIGAKFCSSCGYRFA